MIRKAGMQEIENIAVEAPHLNIKHSISNYEHRRSLLRCWALDVQCWMLEPWAFLGHAYYYLSKLSFSKTYFSKLDCNKLILKRLCFQCSHTPHSLPFIHSLLTHSFGCGFAVRSPFACIRGFSDFLWLRLHCSLFCFGFGLPLLWDKI